MNVSELARRAGISPSAVRFYESAGVLPPAARGPNRYRQYSDDDLCRLRLVVSLRGLGLPLPETGRLAELCVTDKCDTMESELVGLVAARRSEVRARLAELEHLDRELQDLEAGLRGTAAKKQLCSGKEVVSEPDLHHV